MGLSTVFTYAPVLKDHISGGFRIIIITVVIAATAAILAPHVPEDPVSEEKTGGEG